LFVGEAKLIYDDYGLFIAPVFLKAGTTFFVQL
jgi:hypothetical protein